MSQYVPPIIEKVYNVQGSLSAPAVAEYHKYRTMRRRDRTMAAVMEKEIKERKMQKEFEVNKEIKKERLELERLKKKRRRDLREKNKKLKKKFIKVVDNKKDIFNKNIPLIDQIKNELGENLQSTDNNVPNNYQDDYLNDDYNFDTKCKKGKRIIRNEIELNTITEATKVMIEEKPNKAFQINRLEFNTFEEYEEHLQIMDMLEKEQLENNKEKVINIPVEESEQIKYAEETENIIIHDDDF
jgi:hypothetical protein